MALLQERVESLRRLGVEVAKRPTLMLDLPQWLRDRQRTTLELRSPWWPYGAADAVAKRLPAGASVFEFGGGGSTLWLHDKGAKVTTVEHHRGWHDDLRRLLPDEVTLILREPTTEGSISSEGEPGGFFDDYVATVSALPDESLDLVIVDGRARVACGLAAMGKVKRGGMLLLDDSDRPRYAPLRERLEAWAREDFRGLGPGGGRVQQTSVWEAPIA